MAQCPERESAQTTRLPEMAGITSCPGWRERLQPGSPVYLHAKETAWGALERSSRDGSDSGPAPQATERLASAQIAASRAQEVAKITVRRSNMLGRYSGRRRAISQAPKG